MTDIYVLAQQKRLITIRLSAEKTLFYFPVLLTGCTSTTERAFLVSICEDSFISVPHTYFQIL